MCAVSPRWRGRRGTDTYLRDNCWAMIEALTVQLPPRGTAKPEAVVGQTSSGR